MNSRMPRIPKHIEEALDSLTPDEEETLQIEMLVISAAVALEGKYDISTPDGMEKHLLSTAKQYITALQGILDKRGRDNDH